ncbi:MAG: 4-amino-4-deoxy-L-arabinose transferase-like glycosyltransferase [Chitinophagales bacterium]|jgi:4-amino-4-deoxy-L-arabinose transferase-like glycosyltransferase
MKCLDKIPYKLLLILIGAVLFIPYLGNAPLFDWDEINFAESAREMLISGNYLQVQIDFQAFAEKPPFFIWMQALSMKLFGVNEFAARLPNALIGITTMLALLAIGKRLKDKHFGALWALIYVSSFLPHFYFKSALIDPLFNLFIFTGIYFASKLTENDEFTAKKKRRKIRNMAVFYAGLFIGLAVLTKGPVGLLLFSLTYLVLFAISRFKRLNNLWEMIYFGIICLATISVWYGLEWYVNGPAFLEGFFQRHIDLLTTSDAGHGGPFFYHFLVLFLGCFPASVFIFGGIKNHDFSTGLLHNFQRWMLSLLIVVLVVFSLVQTKIIHYSSLAYFPITFFASYFIYYLLQGKRKWRWYHATLFLFIGIVWGAAIALVPVLGKNTDVLVGIINGNDPFAAANLQAKVFWSYYESIYGLSYILVLVIAGVLFALKHIRLGVATLFIGTCVIIQLVVILFTPRIEKYTQDAAIQFYQEKASEQCYIQSLGFKSYAPLFYGQKAIELKPYTTEELLNEYIEEPVYFVSKIDRKDGYLEKYPQLELIMEKNGFVFYQKRQY